MFRFTKEMKCITLSLKHNSLDKKNINIEETRNTIPDK